MHGFFDVFTGSVIGFLLFLFRFFFGKQWDQWLLATHNESAMGLIFTPLSIIAGYVLLIHFHVEPVDDCPCFDDSVAFIGVLIGIDISHWLLNITNYLTYKNPFEEPIIVRYDFDEFGLVKSIIRVVMGVTFVVIWKTISKPVIFTVLPPIYKFIGVYLPRKNYQPTAFSKNY